MRVWVGGIVREEAWRSVLPPSKDLSTAPPFSLHRSLSPCRILFRRTPPPFTSTSCGGKGSTPALRPCARLKPSAPSIAGPCLLPLNSSFPPSRLSSHSVRRGEGRKPHLLVFEVV